MTTQQIEQKLTDAYNELSKPKGADGISTWTNHEAAWDAATKIVNEWTRSQSTPTAVTPGAHEVTTDTNLLIMTDGQTTKGEKVLAEGSLIIGQVNRHDGHYSIDGQRQLTLDGSILNDKDQPVSLHMSSSVDTIIKDGRTQEVIGSDGNVIGWVTRESITAPHSSDPAALVFVPNHAAGYHDLNQQSLIASGRPVSSHAVPLRNTDQTTNLENALDALSRVEHHSDPFLIGVGLTGHSNSLAADLHMTMGGSLPEGSHVETITDQQSSSALGQVIGQVVNQAVQVNRPPSSYTWEFNFNAGEDGESQLTHFELGFGKGGLGTLGSSSTIPIPAFNHKFGNAALDSVDPSVHKGGDGLYEVHATNLGTFEINLGKDYSNPGDHHASIKFTPDPGVDTSSGLQGFSLKILDGDNDLAQSSFGIPPSNGKANPISPADEPVESDLFDTEHPASTNDNSGNSAAALATTTEDNTPNEGSNLDAQKDPDTSTAANHPDTNREPIKEDATGQDAAKEETETINEQSIPDISADNAEQIPPEAPSNAGNFDGLMLQKCIQTVQEADQSNIGSGPDSTTATSTIEDPLSESNDIQAPDDFANLEPAEEYQPMIDPPDSHEDLMQ